MLAVGEDFFRACLIPMLYLTHLLSRLSRACCLLSRAYCPSLLVWLLSRLSRACCLDRLYIYILCLSPYSSSSQIPRLFFDIFRALPQSINIL